MHFDVGKKYNDVIVELQLKQTGLKVAWFCDGKDVSSLTAALCSVESDDLKKREKTEGVSGRGWSCKAGSSGT